MKLILLIITLSFSSACTKYAEVTKESFSDQITQINMEISYLKETDWKVGQKKEATVTQNISFALDMPKVSDEDLSYLANKHKVDAWIIRVIAVRNNKTQDLGSAYALFNPAKSGRGKRSTPESISLKIYYAASYASERFRSLKCPTFDHSKRIRSMKVEGENKAFTMHVGRPIPYGEKSQLVEFRPNSFNAGHSMAGNYYIEIAPYNSKDKVIFGGFTRIPMYVAIKEEENISIPSCDGLHPERY